MGMFTLNQGTIRPITMSVYTLSNTKYINPEGLINIYLDKHYLLIPLLSL